MLCSLPHNNTKLWSLKNLSLMYLGNWLNTFILDVSHYSQELSWVSITTINIIDIIHLWHRCNECCRLLWIRGTETRLFWICSMLRYSGYSLCFIGYSWAIHPIQMYQIPGTKSKIQFSVGECTNVNFFFLSRFWNL